MKSYVVVCFDYKCIDIFVQLEIVCWTMKQTICIIICLLQVVCCSLRLREDIDIGYILLGDLQKNCMCIYSLKE